MPSGQLYALIASWFYGCWGNTNPSYKVPAIPSYKFFVQELQEVWAL